MELVTLKRELHYCEGVNDFLGKGPHNLNGPLRVDNIELIQATLEVILKWLGHSLDEFLWYLQDSHTLEVNDSDPVLYLPWDKCSGDDKLDDECGHLNQDFRICLDLLEFVDINVEDWPECTISLINVSVTLVQFFHPEFEDVRLYRKTLNELMVFHERVIGLLKSELCTFKEPLDEPILIIVANRLKNIINNVVAAYPYGNGSLLSTIYFLNPSSAFCSCGSSTWLS